jgi:uncharacterized protein with GYD domain
MATYVALIRFTEQGAKNVRDTRQRAAAFRESAQAAGVTVREQYWTLGAYDGLLVLDAPDEASVTAAMVALGALGNVRTQTMRAFDDSEVGDIVGRSAGGATGGGGGGSGNATRGRRGR